MKKLNTIDWVCFVLVFIGGLNWGLIGFFGFDLVGTLFGSMGVLARVIYALVGLAALYQLVGVSTCCGASSCSTKSNS